MSDSSEKAVFEAEVREVEVFQKVSLVLEWVV